MEKKKFIEPDPAVKDRLMKAFDERYPAPRKATGFSISRLMNHPVPFYQAGLAASVLLFFMFYHLLRDYRTAGEVAKADTIYIDKPVRIKDTVWMEKAGGKEARRKTDHQTGKQLQPEQNLPVRTENELYSQQMTEALNRVSVISAMGRERSVVRDRELLMLVEAVH